MSNNTLPRLTSLSSCAGCAAKLGQEALKQVLRGLPEHRSHRVLVGSATADDAGVYRLQRRFALVQTVDFFTPIVDEPSAYGHIAAANALSDVFAMGGRPLTALAIVGMPVDTLSREVIRAILRGGAAKVKEARCVLIGGHTIKAPEPIYGLAVTGGVDPARLITNAAARPGDLLVLTKPLGTGIVTTAIKRGLASTAVTRRAVRSMRRLNLEGALVGEAGLVRAGTDVTGFGLLGHLRSLCAASGVGACVALERLPTFGPEVSQLIEAGCVPGGTKDNLRNAEPFVEWSGVDETGRFLMADAQTSGGLLLCVPPRNLGRVRQTLEHSRALTSCVIGRIEASRRPRILATLRLPELDQSTSVRGANVRPRRRGLRS